MKKYSMIVAAFLALYGLAHAGEAVKAPNGVGYGTINADYGGVDIATNSFYVGLATVPTGVGPQGINYADFSTTTKNNMYANNIWRIYGVMFSTGNCSNTDYVSVQVSSAGAIAARELTRFYNNVSIDSTSVASNLCGGFSGVRWPIRAYGNLFFGQNFPNAGGAILPTPYIRADLLYWKEPD